MAGAGSEYPRGRRGGAWAAARAVALALAVLSLGGLPTASADVGFAVDEATCTAGPDASKFFDTAGLECRSCPAGATRSGGGYACSCSGNTFLSLNSGLSTSSGLLVPTCAACPAGSVPSRGGGRFGRCVRCDTSGGDWWSPARANSSGSACECAAGADAGVVVETDPSGAPLLVDGALVARCVACPSANALIVGGACQPCDYPKIVSDGACRCPSPVPAGTSCFDGTDLAAAVALLGAGKSDTSANQVTFRDVPSASGAAADVVVTSAAVTRVLGPAALDCWEKADPKACNAVANVCVLQDFDAARGAACAFLEKIAASRVGAKYHAASDFPFAWSLHTPFVQYEVTETGLALGNTDLMVKISLNGSDGADAQVAVGAATSRLRFKLATWALDGTWLGLRPLGTQLQPCGPASAEASSWQRVGVNYAWSCEIPTQDLLNAGEDVSGTRFYELFLEDGDKRLYPVPVLNRSQRDNGVEANPAGADYGADPDRRRLTRRFFVLDTESGVGTAGPREAIRYASRVKISIGTRPEPKGTLLPPLLEVEYASRDPSVTGSAAPTNPSEFTAEWTGDDGSFWEAFEVMLIVFVVVGGALTVLRFFLFNSRRGSAQAVLGPNEMLSGLAGLADITANMLFLACAVAGAYWLFLFKLQTEAFAMLPADRDATFFYAVLCAAAVLKSFSVAVLVFVQSQFGVSFVDWEKPRKVLVPGTAKEGLAPTSCWRTLLIANEWSELAAARYSWPEATLFVLVLALEGLRWTNVSGSTPDAGDLEAHAWVVDNGMMRAGLSTLVWAACVAAQYLLRLGILDRFVGNPASAFVDLCYMANVSMFLFSSATRPEFGYYVHGRSTMTSTDTSLEELQLQLKREEGAVVGGRGLVADAHGEADRDCQTFEVHLDGQTAAKYAELVALGAASMAREGGDATPAYAGLPQMQVGVSAAEALRQVSYLLRRVVADVTSNARSDRVLAKGFLDHVFRMPPALGASTMDSRPTMFVYDHAHSFMRMTFYGKDFTLTMWELIVFVALDWELRRPAVSAAVTWILVRVLSFARQQLGQRQFSKAALIDSRFLI